MALYPGETLKARLDREGPLPVGDALAIARQIAEGLAYAHAAGIVHRDLKPGNVMLVPNGPVKILDFGLAKARDQSLSTASAQWGTVAYMAPEQIQGEAVDACTDLWALGVVLFEMLTGRAPSGSDLPSEVSPALGTYWDEVFRRCHTRVERRYEDVDAFLRELGRRRDYRATWAALADEAELARNREAFEQAKRDVGNLGPALVGGLFVFILLLTIAAFAGR